MAYNGPEQRKANWPIATFRKIGETSFAKPEESGGGVCLEFSRRCYMLVETARTRLREDVKGLADGKIPEIEGIARDASDIQAVVSKVRILCSQVKENLKVRRDDTLEFVYNRRSGKIYAIIEYSTPYEVNVGASEVGAVVSLTGGQTVSASFMLKDEDTITTLKELDRMLPCPRISD